MRRGELLLLLGFLLAPFCGVAAIFAASFFTQLSFSAGMALGVGVSLIALVAFVVIVTWLGM